MLKNQQCCISFSILTATAKACQQQVSGFKMYLMLQQQACCCLYPSCEEALSKVLVLLRLRRSFIPVLTCMSRCMGYVKCVLCLRVPMSSCRVLKNHLGFREIHQPTRALLLQVSKLLAMQKLDHMVTSDHVRLQWHAVLTQSRLDTAATAWQRK